MRSEIDIIKGLSDMLRSNFSTISVEDIDVAEGFDRSCFAVAIMDMEDGQVGEMEEINANVDVYYFSKDLYSGYLELLNMKKTLSKLLKDPIKVSDSFFFTCDNLSFTLSMADKALAVNFDVQLVQDYEKDSEYDEYMENLIIDETEV